MELLGGSAAGAGKVDSTLLAKAARGVKAAVDGDEREAARLAKSGKGQPGASLESGKEGGQVPVTNSHILTLAQ